MERTGFDRAIVWIVVIVLAAAGLALLAGGVQLVLEGGSPYYVLAGLAVLASALGLVMSWPASIIIFAAFLAATLAWSMWEAGLDGWALMPRLVAPTIAGLFFLIPAVSRASGGRSRWWVGVPILAIVVAFGASAVGNKTAATLAPAKAVAATTDPEHGEWRHWGRTLAGQRYQPSTQITTANVDHLKLAWQFNSDVPDFGFHGFEATPLAVDDRLYLCVDRSVVVALDQDTGRELWRVDPKANLEGVFAAICRGVSYYEAPQPVSECQKRVIMFTADNRLMAVDAESGQACAAFGDHGTVDLGAGLGEIVKGHLYPTSPPAIVNGVIVLGHYIIDGTSTDEPSGVVRGFDAVTGELRWAWDLARPERTGAPPPGETYTRATPNAWTIFSADEELGLVYLPTGNTTPDYYGAQRTPEDDKYSSSIVALDAKTGQVRWSFQTVHHDLWDYDVGSQPVLIDLDGPNGKIPALIAPTKQAQLFVLDRRDGHPIDAVEERPVSQNGLPEERLSKTQPYTTGFAQVTPPDLRERDMWGMTPFDQLYCRLAFKGAHYDGQFTPSTFQPTIVFPGPAGGPDWGSATVDPDRGLLVVNTLQMASIGHFIKRADAEKMNVPTLGGAQKTFLWDQTGTPYKYMRGMFNSPLGVPCFKPPFGTIYVFDIPSRKLLWSKPLGTAERSGPWGIESHLPFEMGPPALGGSVATGGGLVFIAATQDRYFRAFDSGNGRELWRTALPAGGSAVPMSYVSRKSGRQYVVIAAGGNPALGGPGGGHVMAYALPQTAPTP